MIPRVAYLRETIFRLAHDELGHFGIDKSYASACPECARNKSRTTKPCGPLHPLPVPDHRGDSVAMDFIGPLPTERGFDGILTITDRLFFDNWYSKFWKALHRLTGVK